MKYKLTKQAWTEIGKKAGWTKKAGAIAELPWDSIVVCNWKKIANVLRKSLSSDQMKALLDNDILSLDGFDIEVVGSYSEENIYWLDAEIHDMNKFVSYLGSISPDFLRQLEESAEELCSDKWTDILDFKLVDDKDYIEYDK